MAKYAITYVDEDGVEMRRTMTEKSKDGVIHTLMWLLAETAPNGVRVTYPDGSYYAVGVLDPHREGGPVQVMTMDEVLATLKLPE